MVKQYIIVVQILCFFLITCTKWISDFNSARIWVVEMATSLVFFIIADFKQSLNFITKYVYTLKQVYMEKIGSNLCLLERFMKHLSYLLLHWLKFIRINDIYIFIETITSVSSYVENAIRWISSLLIIGSELM